MTISGCLDIPASLKVQDGLSRLAVGLVLAEMIAGGTVPDH